MPAASKAFTVILLVPTKSGMLEMRQLCVPAASPEDPNEFDQRTATTPTLSAAVPVGKPATADDAPRRRPHKKAGLIEIELAGGCRVRVDREVDAAALERVLEVLARR